MTNAMKRWLFVAFTLICFTAVSTYFFVNELKRIKSSKPNLQVLGEVPKFELTNQYGEPFGSKDLKGKIWVADFIFTRCSGPCPLMSNRFAQLQKSIIQKEGIQLVSFTVDPNYDTEEVLRSYGKKYQAKKDFWHLLTGKKNEIYDLSVNGFHLMAEADLQSEHAFIHSTKMVLVDREGKIRSYYDGSDSQIAQQILRGINMLTSETGLR